ncbi:type II toxin-antitoxin system Phd/YefM family antitoxin [Rhodothermus marinus]|uniref:Antitoxin n=1 Tax=Rhodothermus marinus (strain ATCC 43812 / DSM 4252 / R-10) TaxID=518766 RepID=D0MKU5_RHOM4|nr:type II toxin-antitoxin system prevent-host-death family antitoxin [Rhodothermus marinus]ACY49759.1 prevent-host-death family protein [Rhodothermus marinus DSM 4252]
MPEIGAYEAKTRFSELLRRVEKGERFVITRHGLPVAVLEPISFRRKRNIEEVIQDILEFGRKHSLGGLTIKELIEEGRL